MSSSISANEDSFYYHCYKTILTVTVVPVALAIPRFIEHTEHALRNPTHRNLYQAERINRCISGATAAVPVFAVTVPVISFFGGWAIGLASGIVISSVAGIAAYYNI